MEVTKMQTLLKVLHAAQDIDDLGPDTTIRQLLILLVIARSGRSGTDIPTIQKYTGTGQSSVSRTLAKFGVKTVNRAALIEADLDHADHRRRIVRATPRGADIVASILQAL